MKIPKITSEQKGPYPRNKFRLDPRSINNYAHYEEPVKTQLEGIPIFIVDPHNEVFPFWYKKDSSPATLLHIDAHSDSCADVPSLEELKRNGQEVSIDEYVKKHLDIASFIAPAIFYNLINKVYWIDPRQDTVDKLCSPVREEDGKIRFGYIEFLPRVVLLDYDKAVKDIGKEERLIVDIDLDSFECIEDKDYWKRRLFSLGSLKIQRNLGRKTRNARFAKVSELLSRLKTPEMITIARSQTPVTTTPPENVDFLETLTLDLLVNLYKNR